MIFTSIALATYFTLSYSKSDACLKCSGSCAILPPDTQKFPCYQGDPKNANFCYNTDPLLPDGVVAHCGTCETFGYTHYIQNDPIYKNMQLWSHGKSLNNTKSTSDAPKVQLEVYFEALCPGCQDFTTGALKDVLALDDIRQITDFKIVPYGNTKYDASTNVFTCQHGVDECISDAYELCTLYKLSGDINSIQSGNTAYAAWPYILCMEEAEGNPAEAENCFKSSMAGSGLEWDVVSTCYKEEYDVVQTAGMNATPSHDFVPWVIVDGRVLEYPNASLLASICKSYTGTPPASCSTKEVKEYKWTNCDKN